VRTRAKPLGIDEEIFDKFDIHVHIPAGAIPKDGPSAGVTMITAIVSLLTGRPVNHELAMTGEITLRGHVLPVGGIKEKVLAASRAGIKTVLMPDKCEKDLVEISDDIDLDVEFAFAGRVEDVLEYALGDDIFDGTARQPAVNEPRKTKKKAPRKVSGVKKKTSRSKAKGRAKSTAKKSTRKGGKKSGSKPSGTPAAL